MNWYGFMGATASGCRDCAKGPMGLVAPAKRPLSLMWLCPKHAGDKYMPQPKIKLATKLNVSLSKTLPDQKLPTKLGK